MTITDKNIAKNYFLSLPVESSIQWFEEEYWPSTGINVFEKKFPLKTGYKTYSTDGHSFLVLSSLLNNTDKESIISEFINTKIKGILDDVVPLKNLQDLYEQQVCTGFSNDVKKKFWKAKSTRYFFSSRTIELFKKRNEFVLKNKIINKHNSSGNLSRRNILLENSLSSSHDIPYLQSSIDILINKYGKKRAEKSVQSILEQLGWAQRNILIASMRTFFREDNSICLKFGEKYSDIILDQRVKESYIASLSKAGFFEKALKLLDELPELKNSQKILHKNLSSQKKLLESGIEIEKKTKRKAYTPEKKSIVYHASQALPYHTNGYSTRTQGITSGISNCGWNLSVVARKGYPCDTKIPLDKGSEIVNDGIGYFFDPLANQNNGQNSSTIESYIDEASNYLMERAREFRPELIHSASNYITGLAGIKAARKLGVPSIYEMRGLWHLTRGSKERDYAKSEHYALAHKMELFAAQEADHVISITGALKNFLTENGIAAEKITVAPNAVDLSRFSPIEYDAELAKEIGCCGKIVIGYIGSFVEYEGLDVLIDAVALLPADLKEKVVLLWVGDGVYLNSLLERAKEKNIEDCLISLGKRKFSEVQKLYSLVDICVFSRKGYSVCEYISPLKPFEAMSMKVAVIGSDVAPLKEIIVHEVTGLIHKKEDPIDLSEQLIKLIEDKSLRIRLGMAGRNFVEENRNWDRIGKSVSEVYESILG